MKIISGSSNPQLSKRIAMTIGESLGTTKIKNFSDGELKIQIDSNIDKDVIIIQSTSTPANDHLMELLLLADTAKRAGAQNITAVIPYFGYSRQDRCTHKHGPISASLVIKMIETAGITKVITLDLHSAQLEGVFNIPVVNLSSASLFSTVFEDRVNNIIISPDIGGIPRARNFSSLFGLDLAIINKSRDKNNECFMSEIIGKVDGKKCILIDDIIDSANTICMATELLIKNGAKLVEAYITHPVLSKDAKERVQNSAISKVYVSNSIYHQDLPSKFTVLPVHELISTVL